MSMEELKTMDLYRQVLSGKKWLGEKRKRMVRKRNEKKALTKSERKVRRMEEEQKKRKKKRGSKMMMKKNSQVLLRPMLRHRHSAVYLGFGIHCVHGHQIGVDENGHDTFRSRPSATDHYFHFREKRVKMSLLGCDDDERKMRMNDDEKKWAEWCWSCCYLYLL